MRFLRRRPMKWLSVALAASVVVVLLAATASAHTTTVVQSSPADGATVDQSPAQVTAQFSEELETKQSVMQVFNAGGQQVSDGNGKVDLNDPDHKTMIAALPAALPAGDYTVKWHVYLTDGDDSSGTFGFKVAADPAAQVTAAATATDAASPTAADTAAATAAASTTPVLTVDPTSTPAAAAAQVQATPVGPQSLPATGGDAGPVTWPLAAGLAAVALAGILILGSRARAR